MERFDADAGFDNIVFAGGGNRCFWQAGFWQAAAPALDLAPRRIAAVSAGAAVSALLMAGRAESTLAFFKRSTGANPRNIYPERLLRGRPALPHAAMYREALLDALDAESVARLRAGPEIRVLLARVPRPLGPRSGVLVGFAAYELEKRLRNPVHPRFGRKAGFEPLVVPLQSCEDAEEMARLIMASSSTPPMTPVARWQGHIALDGGLVDNVPVQALGETGGQTLVLLTRRYPLERLPAVIGRVYAMPSAPIPVSKWDYTDPQGLQRAFDLGRKDGEVFARAHARMAVRLPAKGKGAPGLAPQQESAR